MHGPWPAFRPLAFVVFAAIMVTMPALGAHAGIRIFTDHEEFVLAGGYAGTLCTFNPAYDTTLVPGNDDMPGCRLFFLGFRSPDAPDSTRVYIVGDSTGNGRVAGAGPSSEVGEGRLWIWLEGAHIFALDIQSVGGTAITVRVMEQLVLEPIILTGPTTFVGVISDLSSSAVSIELIPGTLPNGRPDPTCFDELRYEYTPLQARRTTWGRVKAAHR